MLLLRTCLEYIEYIIASLAAFVSPHISAINYSSSPKLLNLYKCRSKTLYIKLVNNHFRSNDYIQLFLF